MIFRNNLKVYEHELKGASSSNSQSIAFMSAEIKGSTSRQSTANDNSEIITKGYTQASSSKLKETLNSSLNSDEIICSFFAQQASMPETHDDEDLLQIDDDYKKGKKIIGAAAGMFLWFMWCAHGCLIFIMESMDLICLLEVCSWLYDVCEEATGVIDIAISAIESSWSPKWMILSIDFGQKLLSNEIMWDCQSGFVGLWCRVELERDGSVCGSRSRGGEDR
ncbi:hypothetical protein Tco_0597601 [Tanacetum coccineum]